MVIRPMLSPILHWLSNPLLVRPLLGRLERERPQSEGRPCCTRIRGSIMAAMAIATGVAFAAGPHTPAVLAGPVLCTTTLEAPIAPGGSTAAAAQGPVEVTRCGAIRTAPELMSKRFYNWRAPFARGIDLTHQITDFFGIAMGGGDGTKVMGFGFPDQAIVWDGSAVENTANVFLEDQSDPMPLRTADLPSVFTSSLGGASAGAGSPLIYTPQPLSWNPPVRGLW
jgi:hypothetical protein